MLKKLFVCVSVFTFLFININHAYSFHDVKNLSNSDIVRIFQKELNIEGEVRYILVPRGVIVSIDSRIFFEKNSIEIKESALPVLDNLAKIILYIDKICVVEGSVLEGEENSSWRRWEISMMQVENIVDYLIKCVDIEPQKISALGFGDILPLKDAIKTNRIDFVILNYKHYDGRD